MWNLVDLSEEGLWTFPDGWVPFELGLSRLSTLQSVSYPSGFLLFVIHIWMDLVFFFFFQEFGSVSLLIYYFSLSTFVSDKVLKISLN